LRFAALMLFCGFIMSLASVIFKYFAVRDAFWVTTFWTYAGEALFGLAILAVPHYRRQFLALFRKSPGAVVAINGANELINLGASLGVRFAYLCWGARTCRGATCCRRARRRYWSPLAWR
jgi:hypothetical protein